MFRGVANVSLDARGRFAMPARYREGFAASAGKVIVTIDVASACLLIYPQAEYEALEEKLCALDNTLDAIRSLQRKFIGFASESELDSNGRILIPGELRDYADVDRKAVLLGQVNKLELWAQTQWRETVNEWRHLQGVDALSGLAGVQL